MWGVSADVRYAVRTLRRSPWYAAAVICVLAIGLALATVTVAVVDGVLFKPLPFPDADELFLIRADSSAAPRLDVPRVSAREVAAWREALPDAGISAILVEPNPSSAGGRERISAAVDDRFFDVIGVRPLVGGFTDDDYDGAWRGPAGMLWPTLIAHGTWQREFGGDPDVVGQVVITRVSGGSEFGYRIAGVLPPDFVLPVDGREVSTLTPMTRPLPDGGRELHVIARTGSRPVGQARQILLDATRRLALEPPAEDAHHYPRPGAPFDAVRLVPVHDHLAARERPAFAMVFVAAGLLLLTACVNIAGLAAARNLERRTDLAVRRALGAGTLAMVRGLVAEVGLLAAAALGLAFALAAPLLAWTVDLLPRSVALLKTPAIDARVFAGSALLTGLCLAAVVVWPAIVAARIDPKVWLSTSMTSTGRSRRSRLIVVASQVAIGFVLLMAGGLTIVSVAAAYRNDTGFARENAVILEVFAQRPPAGARAVDVLRSLPDVIASVPGVTGVAASSIGPVFAQRANLWTEVVPEAMPSEIALPGIVSREVSASFFDVLGMRLVEGRRPSAGEWAQDRPIAIVSATAARMLWPNRSAIGQRLAARSDPRRTYGVIGVVADARFAGLDAAPAGDIYLPDPLANPGRTGVLFHVRTSAHANEVLPVLLSALNGRGLLIAQAATHEEALFASVKHRVLPAWLFGTLGASALVMIGCGMLGLLAMSVAERRREIGIRLALGASPLRIITQLAREEMAGVALGLAAGALCSAWAVRLLESQLYGVGQYDAGVWLSVAACVSATALAGALLPSVRALRTNPAIVLRDA